MALTDEQRRIVLEHNRQPRHRGRLKDANLSGEGSNPLCGDRLRFELRVEGERLQELAYEGDASAMTLAACSMMAELVSGRTLAEVRDLGQAALDLLTRNPDARTDPRLGDFNVFLSLRDYPNRIKTATLPWASLLGVLAGRERISTDLDPRGG